MKLKVYVIWLLVIALVLGSWTVTSAMSSSTQLKPVQNTNDCQNGTRMLVGNLATQRVAINRSGQICDFNIQMNQLNSKVSDLDRRFITASIAGNMLEIQSLNYALGQAQNEEWRGLIQMMIAQHTADLNMAIKIAKKINANSAPDLTNVRVYPGTPDYDLGIRRVDLVAKFLNPLMSAGGGPITPTVTGVPTDMTGTATGIATMDTETPSATSPVDLTGTATGIATMGTETPSATSTVDLTGTSTGIATMDTATPSATSTVDLTGTATGIATMMDTATPSATSTVDMTGTATGIATMDTTTPSATPTAPPTFVPTIPTIPGGPTANFDLVSLLIIQEEHVMLIETALAAEQMVQNDEIRAFAKHEADMAQLHLIFISDIQQRMLGLTVSPPVFQKDYESPRRFGPDGGND